MRAAFIEMSCNALSSKTRHFEENVIHKNDTIMVFDIDYCLYQNSKMWEAEKNFNRERLRNIKIDYDSLEWENYVKSCESSKSDLEIDYDSLRWKNYVKSCGSSKRALNRLFGFSLEKISNEYDFQSVEKFLKPNIELKNLLKSIQCKKLCLTNGFKVKAEKILTCLDLLDCFTEVFCADVEHTDFILKPAEKAYKFVEQFLQITDANRPKIIFFDDSKSNCETARELKWTAINVQAPKKIEDYLREYILDPEVFEKNSCFVPCINTENAPNENITFRECNPRYVQGFMESITNRSNS